MSLVQYLKTNLPRLPYCIGNLAAKIPYEMRPLIGKTYRLRKNELGRFKVFSSDQKKEFILDRMRKLVSHAYENILFYKELYDAKNFHPKCLVDYEMIQSIPIVTKKDLASVDLNFRSSRNQRHVELVNTGGSTGQPLSFYIHSSSYGHEKAHMDHIWAKLGYSNQDCILTFSGRSKLDSPVQYDGLRHAFQVDIYKPVKSVAANLERLTSLSRMPKFIHGYPSAIYDFMVQLVHEYPHVADSIRSSVKGVFLGSEFPNPAWRKEIESITASSSMSWYGHTERCVLAYESGAKFEYCPLQTYGLAESVATEYGEQLVGTSYYNFASPLIRYNTEDGIETTESIDGLLNAFKIVNGRVGEFILDKNGKRIALTGLVYGRHHLLFNYCRSIQISQEMPGVATVHYCPLNEVDIQNASDLFDVQGVDMKFVFERCNSPIRSRSGKLGLLVNSTDV